jgi:CRISPR-associated protein Csm3
MAQHNFRFQGKFVITGKLECVTGTRIGGTQEKFEIGGIENPVIKDPLTDLPYIPGSSLKGKLRHLLEWARDTKAIWAPHPKHKIFTACHCGECVACRLFGVASDESQVRLMAGPTRLTVRDAFPTGYEDILQGKEPLEGTTVYRWWEMLGKGIGTELKSENFLNRLTAEANPRTIERVPAGSEFQVEFVLDVYDANGDRELLGALVEAMKLLEHSALGGSGSRGYGRVRFKGLKVEWFPVTYYRTGEGKKDCDVGTVDELQKKVSELWKWVGDGAKGSEG